MDDFLGTSIQYSELQIKKLEEEYAIKKAKEVEELINSGFLDSDYEDYSDSDISDIGSEITENSENKADLSSMEELKEMSDGDYALPESPSSASINEDIISSTDNVLDKPHESTTSNNNLAVIRSADIDEMNDYILNKLRIINVEQEHNDEIQQDPEPIQQFDDKKSSQREYECVLSDIFDFTQFYELYSTLSRVTWILCMIAFILFIVFQSPFQQQTSIRTYSDCQKYGSWHAEKGSQHRSRLHYLFINRSPTENMYQIDINEHDEVDQEQDSEEQRDEYTEDKHTEDKQQQQQPIQYHIKGKIYRHKNKCNNNQINHINHIQNAFQLSVPASTAHVFVQMTATFNKIPNLNVNSFRKETLSDPTGSSFERRVLSCGLGAVFTFMGFAWLAATGAADDGSFF